MEGYLVGKGGRSQLSLHYVDRNERKPRDRSSNKICQIQRAMLHGCSSAKEAYNMHITAGRFPAPNSFVLHVESFA